MKRKIIKIDEQICNGCSKCADACPEGAIQMINGKARLVSENYCDGLGACIGDCPVNAITIVEREAKEYDEKSVIKNIVKQGEEVITAHLNHLKDHGENEYYNIAEQYLKSNGFDDFLNKYNNGEIKKSVFKGCLGSMQIDFSKNHEHENQDTLPEQQSELSQWPVQMHLISPNAGYFNNADILIAADCTAYALGNFHSKYLKGKKLVICCPKLDNGLDEYRDKITALIDTAEIKSLSILIMQVPCCSGLLHIAKQAVENAKRKIHIKYTVVGLKGDIIKEGIVDFSEATSVN